MKIEILGMGCPKCKLLEQNVKEALEQTGAKAEVIKIEDLEGIMNKGVMSTPALLIDEEVVAQGKILDVNEIVKAITK